MTIWIVLTILTSIVVVVLAIPVIRRLEAPRTDEDRLMQVSRDQLAEIEADEKRGTLTEHDAAEARAEVERRVLAVAKSAPEQLKPTTERGRAFALVAITGWVVAGATGLYAYLGRPDLPSKPAVVETMEQARPAASAERQLAQSVAAPAKPGTSSVEEAISKLITRLEEKPDDAEGWRMLGWSYFNTERYAEAAESYGKAVKLDGSLPEVWSAYGETLVRTARGLITDEAAAAFDEALKLNPEDPRARFFKGMALEQAGNPTAAIEAWLALADSAPADADWLAGVVTRIEELAAASNYDLGTRLDGMRTVGADLLPPSGGLPPASSSNDRGPTAADVAAAGTMSPEDRQAMIQGMVEQLASRLQDNPDDPEGWVKLIRSRLVMKDADGAAGAYADAKSALGASPEKMAVVTQGALALGLDVN
jgi:cytochrome c-type biogenesis protein CcmH